MLHSLLKKQYHSIMHKKLCMLLVMVSRGCQEFALGATCVAMVLIHHKNAVQPLLWYSFNQVVMEEAVFYLLFFSWKHISAWKRFGPSGGLHLQWHVRIQGHLILPRGVHIWPRIPASESMSLLGRHWHEKWSLWSQGRWISVLLPLKSSFSWQLGWFILLIGICHRGDMEHGGWGINYQSSKALKSRIHI